MTGGSPRFFMHLHNMQQQRTIAMIEATQPQGPPHAETWISSITITGSTSGLGVGTYTAMERSRQGARDAASRMALIALGINVNSLA